MKINSGIFAGVVVDEAHLQPWVLADGTVRKYWPTTARTAHFLEHFPPSEGWAVTVTATQGMFTMPDRYPAADGSSVAQPTMLFVARLSKNGVVMAEASTLATMYGPKAWETGETGARGRLYDALGLSMPIGGESLEEVPAIETLAPVLTPVTPPPAASPTPATPEPEPTPAASPAVAEESVPSAATTSSSPRKAPTAAVASSIDRNLLRTIELQAAARGVTVPPLATTQEAKAFYKHMLTGGAA